jgi:hypothetical protein
MKDYHNHNFWKDFPELTIAPGLDKLYKEDKSKDKKDSSLVMWAVDLCENLNSKFYSNPKKYDIVADKILKDSQFNWKKIEDVLESYKECVLTEAERALTIWNETMRLRNTSLKMMYQDAFNLKDTDELVKLDKMLAATPKMFDDYKKIKQDYEAEQTMKKGGRIGSLSDDDLI